MSRLHSRAAWARGMRGAAGVTGVSLRHAPAHPPVRPPSPSRCRASHTSQVLVTAFVAFCGPGFFNALQGLGGAGNANPSANDAANVALYLCLTASGALGGAFFNVLGARVLMCAGGLTYALYALCAYLNGHSQGFGRLFVASGGVLGLGAGWLWTAQGALMMAYAPMGRKGYYIGLFWLVFNSGGCIGGLLQLGMLRPLGNAACAPHGEGS